MKSDTSKLQQKNSQIKKDIDKFFSLPNPTNDKVTEQYEAWKGSDVGVSPKEQSKKLDKICI